MFGTWFKGEIDKRGWDQRAAALHIGVKETTVHNWIHQGKKPTTKNAIKIALGMGIPITEVMAAAGYDVPVPGTEEEREKARLEVLAGLPQFAEIIDLIARQPPKEQATYIDIIRRLLLPPGSKSN